MSIAELTTLYAEYKTARRAADYDAAIGALMDMKAQLATTPNLTRSMGGAGSQGISWNSEAIDGLIAQCRALKSAITSASSGLQQMKVTYARADATSEYA